MNEQTKITLESLDELFRNKVKIYEQLLIRWAIRPNEAATMTTAQQMLLLQGGSRLTSIQHFDTMEEYHQWAVTKQ